MDEKIVTVLNEMSEYLSIAQMKKLQEVIISTFAENEVAKKDIPNDEFLEMFLQQSRLRDVRSELLIIIELLLNICFHKQIQV